VICVYGNRICARSHMITQSQYGSEADGDKLSNDNTTDVSTVVSIDYALTVYYIVPIRSLFESGRVAFSVSLCGVCVGVLI
jgi:hypothetical protein